MKQFTIQTGVANILLRAKSAIIPVSQIRWLIPLANEMVCYLRNPDHHGVGLAAPQIGINKRLIAVSLLRDYDDEDFRTIAMINPVIVDHGNDSAIDTEGCLSLPGEEGHVRRHYSITVTFYDTLGKTHKRVFIGLSARIIQHEIDHLDGILFIDRVEKSPLLAL